MLSNEAVKMMIKKLKIEADTGRIDNEWAENFINKMFDKTKLEYYPFSEKQANKIEELFNKY
jgi:hypothetical protein